MSGSTPPVADLAVVGGGPAGLSGAVTAAQAGCRVVMLDSAPQLGGQFWRHRDDDAGHGHRAWSTFAALRAELLASAVDYRAATAVWFAEADSAGFTLHVTGGAPVRARHVLVATGSHDRVLPFPGWDLPGVVTAGAAQALLKGSGVAVGARVVVAGAGPFLLPVAAGLLSAGVEVAGVFEAGRPRRYLRAPWALSAAKLIEGAGYLATLAWHGTRYRTGRAVVAARGEGGVSAVEVARLDRRGRVAGAPRTVACDTVAVGFGFTPQLELPLALGCATRLDVDGSLVVDVDVAGRTSVTGVYAAGEVTGVGGAQLSLLEGRLAATVVALATGRPSPLPDRELSRLLSRRAALRRFAALMHRVHAPPSGWASWLRPDTLVCRCEEVPYEAVRSAVTELGASTGRAVKGLCRPGMGWCQGRVCGYATASLTAGLRGRELRPEDLETFARRPVGQPVTLGELAGQGDDQA